VREQAVTLSGNGQRDSIVAECENDIPVIGGGFFSEAPYGEMSMTGTIPVNVNTLDPTLDGWSEGWSGSPSMAWEIATLAICDETKPKYVEKTSTLKPGKRKFLAVNCPANRHVYGGGIGSEILQPGPLVSSSYPADSNQDSNKAPDDRWKLSADNESVSEVEVSAFAICGKAKPAYRARKTTVMPGSQGGIHTPCPNGSPNPIGGGQKVTGAYRTTAVHDSSPNGAGWDAQVDNSSADDVTLTTYAVCVGNALK
jgi:hypothetical protein